MGVGDQVPPAIEQLGAKVQMITAEDLAWGDLSRFDAIVTGVRAYERRDDLRANNSRLLEYVFNGGTLIVQYNKFEFNDAQYGPYPAKVSSNRDDRRECRSEGAELGRRAAVDARTRSARRRGRTGCRSAASTSSMRTRTRGTAICCPIDDNFTYNKGAKTGALVEATLRQGPLGLRRARTVASAAGRHRRRVSDPGQPDFAR